nr:putative coat protein [Vinca ringspot virus]
MNFTFTLVDPSLELINAVSQLCMDHGHPVPGFRPRPIQHRNNDHSDGRNGNRQHQPQQKFKPVRTKVFTPTPNRDGASTSNLERVQNPVRPAANPPSPPPRQVVRADNVAAPGPTARRRARLAQRKGLINPLAELVRQPGYIRCLGNFSFKVNEPYGSKDFYVKTEPPALDISKDVDDIQSVFKRKMITLGVPPEKYTGNFIVVLEYKIRFLVIFFPGAAKESSSEILKKDISDIDQAKSYALLDKWDEWANITDIRDILPLSFLNVFDLPSPSGGGEDENSEN